MPRVVPNLVLNQVLAQRKGPWAGIDERETIVFFCDGRALAFHAAGDLIKFENKFEPIPMRSIETVRSMISEEEVRGLRSFYSRSLFDLRGALLPYPEFLKLIDGDLRTGRLKAVLLLQKPEQSEPGGPAQIAKLTDADFEEAAKTLGPDVQVAMVRAVAEVESGGRSGFGPGGMPIIAYEGHWFRKFTGKKYDKAFPFLSYPYKEKAGPEWQKNNKDQETAWATLSSAIDLNREAALKSCSWGMFQIMGFNYDQCGFQDVESFVLGMKAGERGQLDAFVGFCKKKGIVASMASKDFVQIATKYNGSDFGDYDKRMEKAFKKHGGK